MTRVRNDDRPGAPTIGGVNELLAFFGISDDTLDGGRLWADNGNHPVSGHNVAKTNVDQLNVHAADCVFKGKAQNGLVSDRIWKNSE